VNSPSDSGDTESEPFEREPFDAERVADDPVGAFGDDDQDAGTRPDTPEDTPASALENADVDTGLRVLFWKLVLLYKVSIIGGSLGVLLLVFDQGPDVGLELVAGGLVLLGYSLYATKRGKKRIEAGEFDSDDPGGEPTEEAADPASVSDAQGGDA
jgi:hypothetical protein